MEKTRLRELLEELHTELGKADSVELEAQDLLRGAMDDIHGALDRAEAPASEEGSPGDHGSDDDQGINERLNRAVLEFENSHPQVSFAVERLLKSLSDIGI